MSKMDTIALYGKNLKKSFYMPIYVTGFQFNAPSGPGCIAHHHFGTVTLCLQKIDKFILKIQPNLSKGVTVLRGHLS